MTQDQNSEWKDREEPVAEDMGFQRAFWKVQGAGWVAVAALLIGAMLGIFSDGPLSPVRARQEGLAAEYQRFYRTGASSSFLLEIPPGRESEVVISDSIVKRLVLETVLPEPVRSAAASDGTHLIFEAPSTGQVYFGIRPAKSGRVRGAISAGGQTVPIHTFVYP